MAHNLELQADGSYSYIGRQPGWHYLGFVTGKLMTKEEIFEKVLNWGTYKHQLTDHFGNTIPLMKLFIILKDSLT